MYSTFGHLKREKLGENNSYCAPEVEQGIETVVLKGIKKTRNLFELLFS